MVSVLVYQGDYGITGCVEVKHNWGKIMHINTLDDLLTLLN